MKKILKEETNKQLVNVQQNIKEITSALSDKTNTKNKLDEAVIKEKEEIEAMQLELKNVSEQLGNASIDKHMILRLSKEAKTIKALEDLYPDAVVCFKLNLIPHNDNNASYFIYSNITY